MTIEEQFQEIVEGFFIVKSITNVNYKPHPYTIGPEHIKNSKSMYLEPDSAPCAVQGCRLKYAEHTSDKVLFLSILKDLTKDEAQNVLKKLPLEENKIDGVAFIETPEKFRIL